MLGLPIIRERIFALRAGGRSGHRRGVRPGRARSLYGAADMDRRPTTVVIVATEATEEPTIRCPARGATPYVAHLTNRSAQLPKGLRRQSGFSLGVEADDG